MNELSVEEKDLLERVREKPALRHLFFRKAKHIKWFDPLEKVGFFDPKDLPVPTPAEQEGYISIPRWDVLNYLENVAAQLNDDLADVYAPRIINIMVETTNHAKEHCFSNYHAWWQFSQMLSHIPHRHITEDVVTAVDYWLEDQYDRQLVAEELGQKWLPQLLETEDKHAKSISTMLLETLFRVDFVEKEWGGRRHTEASLRLDNYHAGTVVRKVAYLSGQHLKREAPVIFGIQLTRVLDQLEIDTWSSLWQPAIEEHEQNKHHDDPENTLVVGFRDALLGYVNADYNEAADYLTELLDGPYQTIKRVAIYCIGAHPQYYSSLWNNIVLGDYLHSNFRHEIWHFLNENYSRFDDPQKEAVFNQIQKKHRIDDSGAILEGASAYEKATWLAAIKDSGEREQELYREATAIAKVEPDHPDFSSYMEVGFTTPESPYSPEELGSFTVEALVDRLATFEESGQWGEPGIEGLSRAFKQLLVSSPLTYSEHLSRFAELDFPYLYSVVDAYIKLWNEKANLPWNDLWPNLLSFVSAVLGQERLWVPDESQSPEHLAASRRSLVGAVSRLLEAGTKSDDHAFRESLLGQAETILSVILERESGDRFAEDRDAVSIAINSPRGQCIEALINLTLRSCRLEDRRNDNQHQIAWNHFRSYYDDELIRPKRGEYEFATLVTNYLPNFLYLSKKWVLENLCTIFDRSDYLRWLCAMQGYAYVSSAYEEIYKFLRDNDHFKHALDDEHLEERTEERVVQHIAVAYLNEKEDLADKGSMISFLIERMDSEEIRCLIWFVWSLRKSSDEKVKNRVLELWTALLDALDLSSKEGKFLASGLCQWIAFVHQIDDKNKAVLKMVAPYVHVSHNSYEMMRGLARISTHQPFEANEIWNEMIKGSISAFPEDAIRAVLENLAAQGEPGERAARETVSAYLEIGIEQPFVWLNEILGSRDKTSA